MPRILIDADACPVKEEALRVARRWKIPLVVVTNSRLRLPLDPLIELVVVASGKLDDVDDWIAERATTDDLVVTADIPLAARCLARGAAVLGPRGEPFTEEGIGNALATRELLAGLREAGSHTGGPPPFTQADRSRFLGGLEEALRRLSRRAARGVTAPAVD